MRDKVGVRIRTDQCFCSLDAIRLEGVHILHASRPRQDEKFVPFVTVLNEVYLDVSIQHQIVWPQPSTAGGVTMTAPLLPELT